MATAKNNNHLLLSQFSGQSATITVPNIYYKLTRCLNKAHLLNQIIFYTGKSTYLKDDWFYKTYTEWLSEILVCERTLRSYLKEFVQEGWIDMRIQKIKGVRTPLFRASLEKISTALLALTNPTIPPDNELEKNQIEHESTQTATIAELVKDCPKRQQLPDSQTATIAVSNTIYTDNYLQKKLTTVEPNCSSSSFFSEKQKEELLSYKLSTDTRNDELFLEHCTHHVENQKNDLSKYQRFTGLKHILVRLNETGCNFKASGFDKFSRPSQAANEDENRIPTTGDWENYKNCVKGFDWVGVWFQKQKKG